MKRTLHCAIILFIAFTTTVFSQVDLGPDIEACDGTQVVLDATTQDATSYQWSVDGQVVPDWTNSTYTVTQSGVYEATAMINGSPSSDSVVVTFNNPPTIGNISDAQLEGENGTDFATFDLTSKIPEIVGNNPNVNVTFHETSQDAENGVAAIANTSSYVNTSNPQTIFVRVEDFSSGCASIGSFDLVVITFTTINCNDAPATTTYCYGNNDNTAFRIRSLDEVSTVTVEFFAGQVEENWDELIVLDSDGITQIYNGYGNGGDLTGLTFESSGNEITIQISSDGSVSCGTNSFEPWVFSASCVDYSSLGIINARSFVDDNNNGTFDDDEFLFPYGNILYELNDNGVSNEVSANGNFLVISDDANNSYDFTFVLYEEYEDCYDVPTPMINDVSVALDESITIYFPITIEQPCEDLEVILINPGLPPRPGFTRSNRLILKNNSPTTIASGTVELTIDDLLILGNVTSDDATYVYNSTASGFTIDFTNLTPYESRSYNIELTCPASVPLGTILTNTATYTTDQNDLIGENNSSILSETVVSSWDPNDIRESHGPEIIHEDFTSADYLYYTIRFQNLGTAEAINVRIEETLDTQVDETTFQMIASSHDYQVRRVNDELVWNFDDINLPAEMVDAEGSNGFVYFRIKPKPGYAVGDIIPGVAGIYFDFNAPVITNTFETEFVEPLSVGEISVINIKIYPNPTTDILFVELEKTATVTMQLLDIQGKQMLTKTEDAKTLTLDVSSLQTGIYFLKLSTNTAQFTKKIIVN